MSPLLLIQSCTAIPKIRDAAEETVGTIVEAGGKAFTVQAELSTLGLRDRALISTMLFSFARISAVLSLKRQDFYYQGLQELRAMPAQTEVALLECAGNSRVFLVPHVQGAQWQFGVVGTAEWTGVPLRVLLERAGLEEDACEIVLEGPDRGVPNGAAPPGLVSYANRL